MTSSSPSDVELDALVTVVIPACNVDHTKFRRCLASVLAQSHATLQVLVVDDGSEALSAARLAEDCAVDPRVSFLRQTNKGVSGARNLALGHAAGEFVCFLDADDLLTPRFVESALGVLARTGADVVFGGILVSTGRSSVRWRSGDQSADRPAVLGPCDLVAVRAEALSSSPAADLPTGLTSVCNVVAALYRTNIALGERFRVGVAQGEDRLYNFAVLGAVKSAAFCSEPWYVYDQSDQGSATRSVTSDGAKRIAATVRAFVEAGSWDPPGECAPASREELQRGADTGAFQYFKVMVTRLAASSSLRETVQFVSEVLACPGVHEALCRAPVESTADRAIQRTIRLRRVRTLVLATQLKALAEGKKARGTR